MAIVLLHCPLNISRSLGKMMEEFCRPLQEKHKIEIQIQVQPHRSSEESLFKSYFEKDDLPDLTVGQVDDFANLPAGYLSAHFRSLPGRYPVRQELADIGFTDVNGYFHPFVIIPFAIFYNQNLLEEKDLPRTWKDLLDTRWQRQILMPDDSRMVSVIIKSFMEADFPDDFSNFKANVIHQGSPVEVVNAVDEGKYPLGITNIAFARISSQKNIRIIWPQDGLFCMPQVMVWSQKAAEPLLEIGDFLMSRPVQEYLAMQSFVPVSPDVPLPALISDHNCSLRWKGWESFLNVVKGRHG
jgi:ABC-type Fe3+ transport system substrate-binding protein